MYFFKLLPCDVILLDVLFFRIPIIFNVVCTFLSFQKLWTMQTDVWPLLPRTSVRRGMSVLRWTTGTWLQQPEHFDSISEEAILIVHLSKYIRLTLFRIITCNLNYIIPPELQCNSSRHFKTKCIHNKQHTCWDTEWRIKWFLVSKTDL